MGLKNKLNWKQLQVAGETFDVLEREEGALEDTSRMYRFITDLCSTYGYVNPELAKSHPYVDWTSFWSVKVLYEEEFALQNND